MWFAQSPKISKYWIWELSISLSHHKHMTFPHAPLTIIEKKCLFLILSCFIRMKKIYEWYMLMVIIYSYFHLPCTDTMHVKHDLSCCICFRDCHTTSHYWRIRNGNSKVVHYKLWKKNCGFLGAWWGRESFQPHLCNEVIQICPAAFAIKLQFALSLHIILQCQKWSVYVYCFFWSLFPNSGNRHKLYRKSPVHHSSLNIFCGCDTFSDTLST